MTQGVEEVIANLQTKSTSAGCADAPNYAISQMGPSPFSLAFEGKSETLFHSAGYAEDLATIIVQHHVSENILPKDIAKAAGLRDTFLKAIRDDPTLGNSCEHIVSVRRTFGPLTFGTGESAFKSIGYQYEIVVKIDLQNT